MDLVVLRFQLLLVVALAIFLYSASRALRLRYAGVDLSPEELEDLEREQIQAAQYKIFVKDAKRETKYLRKRIPQELAIQNRLDYQYARMSGTAGRRKVKQVSLPDALILPTGVAFPLNSRAFPYGMSFRDLLDESRFAVRNLEHGINRNVEIVQDEKTKQIFLVVSWYNAVGGLPLVVQWGDVFHELRDRSPFSVVAGKNRAGRLEIVDLTDWPHGLVLGGTGNGKTTFLIQALITLLRRNYPDRLQFYLMDLKGLDFGAFRHVPHVARYSQDPDDAVSALAELVAELDRRRGLMSGVAAHIDEYNKRVGDDRQLPRLFLWCDELAMLTRGGSSTRRKLSVKHILHLVALGRAMGIHVVLGTQTVSKEVLTMDIVANIDGRLCFGVRSVPASVLAIGNGDAVGLRPPGRAVTVKGSLTVQMQSPIATPSEIAKSVKMAKTGQVDRISGVLSVSKDRIAEKWSIDDVYLYALDELGGAVNANKIWKANKGKMARDRIRNLVKERDGRYFSVNGFFAYQLAAEPGTGSGRAGRRAVRVESLADRPDRLLGGLSGVDPDPVKVRHADL